jgi:hypothetical protein
VLSYFVVTCDLISRLNLNYLDVRNSMHIFDFVPTEKCYMGSVLSWLPYSIQYTTEGFLTEHITSSNTMFSFMALYSGCFIQLAVAIILGCCVGAVVFVSVLAMVFCGLFADVMAGRKHKGGFTNFIKEVMFHF